MFIITAFSGNVNLFFKKILSRRRDGRARASAARLAALALDSMDRGASRLEPTARFCPSPRPRPSPAPAGTAEEPLSIAAALSFASPRRDGGGAFVHPRGPVLRQPPPGRRRSLYPSPRPRPSPAPAGTAEGPLSIAAALSFASLPCEREGDRRQAVEGFCPQLRPGRGNPRQLRPASSLANRSRIS